MRKLSLSLHYFQIDLALEGKKALGWQLEGGKAHLKVLVFFFFKTWQTCLIRAESSKSGGGAGEEGDKGQGSLRTWGMPGPVLSVFIFSQ